MNGLKSLKIRMLAWNLSKERGLIVELDVDGEKVKQFASPIVFSETKQEYKFAGKKIGTDTEDILKKLGYSSEKISEFDGKDVFK